MENTIERVASVANNSHLPHSQPTGLYVAICRVTVSKHSHRVQENMSIVKVVACCTMWCVIENEC